MELDISRLDRVTIGPQFAMRRQRTLSKLASCTFGSKRSVPKQTVRKALRLSLNLIILCDYLTVFEGQIKYKLITKNDIPSECYCPRWETVAWYAYLSVKNGAIRRESSRKCPH